MSAAPKITVVGSLNVDHTLRVPRIPAPGETLTSSSMLTCFGGKGANQAVAAARAGGRVSMIGCVGQDGFGTQYLEHLQNENVDTTGVLRTEIPTGSAFIAVDDRGENTIIVNPGANHEIAPRDVDEQAALIRESKALLLQLECPLAVIKRAAEMAREASVRIVINPSPWSADFAEAAIPVDVLIVNEKEAAMLLGKPVKLAIQDIEGALQSAGCGVLVITRGADSTLALSLEHGVIEVAPPKVVPVDTVGAGDSFAGALAVALAEGVELEQALRFANAAGALATQKAGAQPAIPTRQDITALL
ncbi:ribokinase [Brevifollis gellanilyticus]|uniref:Ribokinase n=1 Tax=Brevifollis gellanilyticus TaxID=748831 RepID=A0A512MGM0_9BACT|nr:ribokinase [Brevifollis gellanilyticus]GEP45892.1 ribokinase [Brevifollis gellanilyticus]